VDDDLESLVDCGTYCNEEALGTVGVAPRLHKDIQHNAVLIDNTPKIVFDTLDLDDSRGATYSGLWPTTSQAIGEIRTSCTSAVLSRRCRQRRAQPGSA